ISPCVTVSVRSSTATTLSYSLRNCISSIIGFTHASASSSIRRRNETQIGTDTTRYAERAFRVPSKERRGSDNMQHLFLSFRKIDLDFLLPRARLSRPIVQNREGTCGAQPAYRKSGRRGTEAE